MGRHELRELDRRVASVRTMTVSSLHDGATSRQVSLVLMACAVTSTMANILSSG